MDSEQASKSCPHQEVKKGFPQVTRIMTRDERFASKFYTLFPSSKTFDESLSVNVLHKVHSISQEKLEHLDLCWASLSSLRSSQFPTAHVFCFGHRTACNSPAENVRLPLHILFPLPGITSPPLFHLKYDHSSLST